MAFGGKALKTKVSDRYSHIPTGVHRAVASLIVLKCIARDDINHAVKLAFWLLRRVVAVRTGNPWLGSAAVG